MSRDRLPPAQAEACLTSPRSSRYKGGTVVDERVWTLEQHLKLIYSPDGLLDYVLGKIGVTFFH